MHCILHFRFSVYGSHQSNYSTLIMLKISQKSGCMKQWLHTLQSLQFPAFNVNMKTLLGFNLHFCEAQARVRQGSARDGSQGERPQSLNPCLELTLKLVATHHPPPPPTTTHHPGYKILSSVGANYIKNAADYGSHLQPAYTQAMLGSGGCGRIQWDTTTPYTHYSLLRLAII